jgi:hypothetical protein
MKCNRGPKSYARKPNVEVCIHENHDKGDIIEKERHDQAGRCTVLAFSARQPTCDTQGKQGNSNSATQHDSGWLGKPWP